VYLFIEIVLLVKLGYKSTFIKSSLTVINELFNRINVNCSLFCFYSYGSILCSFSNVYLCLSALLTKFAVHFLLLRLFLIKQVDID
jgi:hypothetical protein